MIHSAYSKNKKSLEICYQRQTSRVWSNVKVANTTLKRVASWIYRSARWIAKDIRFDEVLLNNYLLGSIIIGP